VTCVVSSFHETISLLFWFVRTLIFSGTPFTARQQNLQCLSWQSPMSPGAQERSFSSLINGFPIAKGSRTFSTISIALPRRS
jgi:hypothetical protein